MRNVAERSKVTQALINYYFGSKEGLFKDVYLRRSRQITDARTKNLTALLQSDNRPHVKEVLEAFLMPALQMRESPGGRNFMRLNARLHTEPPEISYKLRTQAYDKSTRIFAETLRKALPHLTAKDAYWRTTLIVGAYLYAFSDTHRLEVMASGVCNTNDPNEVFAAIMSFAKGGMLATSTHTKSDSD